MKFRTVTKTDLPGLLSLWLVCFDDKREAAQLFFERNLSDTHGYLAENNGEIAAAVYLTDCRLTGLPSHYLCGAATLPGYRGRGVMTELIGFALADAAARGDCYSVLMPAEESLYGFYAKMGYQPVGRACRTGLETVCGTAQSRGEPDFIELQRSCFKDKFLLWNKNYLCFARDYYACYGVKSLQTESVFALYETRGTDGDVIYAVFNDIKELKMLLYAVGVRRFTLTGSAVQTVFKGCTPSVCGMARPLKHGLALPDSVYIGVTLG